MTSKSSTGSRPVGRRDVDEVHQHFRAFEMAEKPVPQAVARMRAFDQPGHVGDDECPVA